MINALIMAGLGGVRVRLMKSCRIRAAVPATAGHEWLVPEDAVYHCCPKGQKLLPPGPAQTPLASKQPPAVPLPLPGGLASDAWNTPPESCVPGPTISGFLR